MREEGESDKRVSACIKRYIAFWGWKIFSKKVEIIWSGIQNWQVNIESPTRSGVEIHFILALNNFSLKVEGEKFDKNRLGQLIAKFKILTKKRCEGQVVPKSQN